MVNICQFSVIKLQIERFLHDCGCNTDQLVPFHYQGSLGVLFEVKKVNVHQNDAFSIVQSGHFGCTISKASTRPDQRALAKLKTTAGSDCKPLTDDPNLALYLMQARHSSFWFEFPTHMTGFYRAMAAEMSYDFHPEVLDTEPDMSSSLMRPL